MFKNWGDIFRDPSMRKTFAALELHSRLGHSWMTGHDEALNEFFMDGLHPRTILSIENWDSTRKVFACQPHTEFQLFSNYPDEILLPHQPVVDRIGPFKMAIDYVVATRCLYMSVISFFCLFAESNRITILL